MATRIGCDNLVYALLKQDDGTTAPTWDTIKKAPGVISLNVNPNPAQETLFTDDGPSETASTLGKIEVEIQKDQLDTTQKADLLGHTVDAKGGIIYGANDVPPWVAIGFRTLKSNGKYKYVWLYKGKFMEPEENNETKGDSINFQTDTIKGQFARLNKEFKVSATKSTMPWKYEIDEDHDTADSATIAAWFTAVAVPTEYVGA